MQKLGGKTVLITRPEGQGDELAEKLSRLGARLLFQPAIRILPAEDATSLDAALAALARGEFDWLLFSSANGVEYGLRRLIELGLASKEDLSSFFAGIQTKIGVVGTGTARALAQFDLDADAVPENFNAEGLVAALADKESGLAGLHVLSLRASRGRRALVDELAKLGAELTECAAYRSVDVETPAPEIASSLRAGGIDAAVATSSASARALAAMFGSDVAKTRWVAISELTAGALKECGVDAAGIAREATMTALAETVAEVLSRDVL